MERPHLSVVIAAAEWPPTLADCLGGLSRQSLDGYKDGWGEILLVGPALPAELMDLAPGGPLVVRHLEWNAAARGPGAARNHGAAQATGELYLFLEPDTSCGPGFLAAHAAAHRSHPEPEVGVISGEAPGEPLAAATGTSAGGASGPTDCFYHDPRCPLGLRFQGGVNEEEVADESFLGGLVGTPFSVKRTWFERQGGFAEDPTLRILSGLELECRYQARGFRLVRTVGATDARMCRHRPPTAAALLPWCEAWGGEAYRLAEREPVSAPTTRLGLLLALPAEAEQLAPRRERLQAFEEWLRRNNRERDTSRGESILRTYREGLAELALLGTAVGARAAALAAGWIPPVERLRKWVPSPTGREWVAGRESEVLQRVGDGAELPVVRLAGRRAVRLQPQPGGARRLEFGVESGEEELRTVGEWGWSSVDPLVVTVEYLDAGASTWRLEFLGWDSPLVAPAASAGVMPDSEVEEGWRATAETVQNTNTGSWRRATFHLTGWAAARMGRGAWFRVVVVQSSGPELALGRIRVSAVAGESSGPPGHPALVLFPPAEAPEVSVLVEARGGSGTLAACLHSLYDATVEGYEVLVLDDGVSPERSRYLQECEGVRIIPGEPDPPHAAHLSRPVMLNRATALARGKFLAFLADDVLPLPGWLIALRSELESQEMAGSAGGLLLSPQGLVRHAAFTFTESEATDGTEPVCGSGGRPWDVAFATPAAVTTVSSSALLVRRVAFDSVGGFREGPSLLPLGIDLSFRLAEAGWSIHFCPGSTLLDCGSGPGSLAALDADTWLGLRRRWEELRRQQVAMQGDRPADLSRDDVSPESTLERVPGVGSPAVGSPAVLVSGGFRNGLISGKEIPAFPAVGDGASGSAAIPADEILPGSAAVDGERVAAPVQALTEVNGAAPMPGDPRALETGGIHPLLAPLGMRGEPKPWAGRLARKPWEYPITAVIPHLETPEPLRLCVELLRLQSERPYLLVIDTGSSDRVRAELETLRAEDLEIHYILSHGYQHCAEAVGVAQDLAFALCRSPYLFCTHADCFLRRRDYLEWLLTQCGPDQPVVGYQMSPRDWLTEDWEGMVSHTATLLHMATMHRLGVTWSFERSHVQFGVTRTDWGWPDTETCMNLVLRAAGIQPYLIGLEENFKRHVDENLDHVRSYPGSALYAPHYHAHAKRWMAAALAEATARIDHWRATSASAGPGPLPFDPHRRVPGTS